jgi:hypothetical protein
VDKTIMKDTTNIPEQQEAPTLGSGYTPLRMVPSKLDTPPEEKVVEPTPTKDVWLKDPSVVGQMIEHPTTVRYLPMQVKVFNLSDAKDAEEYGALWAKFTDVKGPRVRISETDRQFYEGTYHVFIMFQDVEYKQLIQKK